MTKKRYIIILLTFLISNIYAADTIVSITTKNAEVRTQPSFLSKILYNLKYADKLLLLDESNGWVKVKSINSDDMGWLHQAAITNKIILLNSGANDVNTDYSSADVSLAGKGFNSEVEKNYLIKQKLDYKWVNKMEQYNVTVSDALNFIINGQR